MKIEFKNPKRSTLATIDCDCGFHDLCFLSGKDGYYDCHNCLKVFEYERNSDGVTIRRHIHDFKPFEDDPEYCVICAATESHPIHGDKEAEADEG